MRVFSLILLTVFFLTTCFSQEKQKDTVLTQELNEVIVSATRTVRQLSSIPLPAQLISKKEIRLANSVRLNEILNEQTGLTTVPDFGGGEGIQMQGLDSQYTLILIDGVPLIGRSAGTLDVSRLSVGNVTQIEIVKGASSSLYGSDALGGVINIITEKPKTGFTSSLNSQVGSFQTYDTNVMVGYNKESYSISAFIDRYSSEGYDLNPDNVLNTVDPFSNYTFNTQFTYTFGNNTDLFLSGRFYSQNQDYNASEDLKGESDLNEWNTHAKLSHKYNDAWSSYFEFYATRYKAEEYLNNPDNTLFNEAYFNQLLVRPEIRATYKPSSKSNFIGGLGINHETLDRTDFSTKPEFNSPYVYLQYDVNPTEKLNIIAGARFDGHNEYKSQLSPKVAIRYKVSEKTALKGSVGYGFKAPDFRQLYFNFSNATVGYTVLGYNAVTEIIPQMEDQGQIATINVPLTAFEAELKPENSVAYNLGLDYRLNHALKFSLNLFRNNVNDLIDTRIIATKINAQNIFSYYNVHTVYTEGLELNAAWKSSNKLKISGGYQLLYAKDKAAQKAFENGEVYARESPGEPAFQLKKEDYFGLYNRSRHMVNFKVFYTIEKWALNTNLRGTYRSKYGLFDTNDNSYLDKYDAFVSGYSVWDFALNKTFKEHYTIGFGINNIFGFTDTQNISNIPGRIIYGKLNINI